MDKKREFDALWNWPNTYMLITDPKNPNVGYFAWSMNTAGTPRSTGPAPDGEEYYAMVLLFAANRRPEQLRRSCGDLFLFLKSDVEKRTPNPRMVQACASRYAHSNCKNPGPLCTLKARVSLTRPKLASPFCTAVLRVLN